MEANLRRFVVTLLGSERDMTFATVRPDGYPQANIVSYANEGLSVYFGTSRTSQKIRNLAYSDKTSITVASPYADWGDIRALSMGGKSQVLLPESPRCRRAVQLLQAKFPEVAGLPDADLSAIALVCFQPITIAVLDYRKGFGHNELVEVSATDIESFSGSSA